MKQPTPREVENGTFHLNSPKRHSHSTQVKLASCVRQVLDGQDLEKTCEKVFGRVTDVLLDDIRTEIGKQCSKKDETQFVCGHRNELKKNSNGRTTEDTLEKTKTFPDNRRVHYE